MRAITWISPTKREEDINYNYELTLKSIIEPYIYILIKKENAGKLVTVLHLLNHIELDYLKEKIIQMDRRKFTIESLISVVMQELELQVMTPKLSQAISSFGKFFR